MRDGFEEGKASRDYEAQKRKESADTQKEYEKENSEEEEKIV